MTTLLGGVHEGVESEGYCHDRLDACGSQYNTVRTHDPSPELQGLLRLLPPAATVLDIGCGGGFPVTAALAGQARVTGVDISAVQSAISTLSIKKLSRYLWAFGTFGCWVYRQETDRIGALVGWTMLIMSLQISPSVGV